MDYNAQKKWGHRVSRLAKMTAVPWEVAALVGDIESDAEAIGILEHIKSSRKNVTDIHRANFVLNDQSLRDAALEEILGTEIFSKLSGKKSKKMICLVKYLCLTVR